MDWFDMIALKNGGYKNTGNCNISGTSGEDIFEKELIDLLKDAKNVLDAGCGHGEFTLKMSEYASYITGFDFSRELLKIAEALKEERRISNVDFIYADTHKPMPFKNGYFDVIYDRRGPTSIINFPELLCDGGVMIGIHSGELELVKTRLERSGLSDIKITEYKDAFGHFENEFEFAKYLTDIPGNWIDYTLPENKDLLDQKIAENTRNGEIIVQVYRFIWRAIRK